MVRRSIWLLLAKKHQKVYGTFSLFLMKACFSLRMKEKTTVRDHNRELKDLIDNLGAIEMLTEEEIQVCILLMSLTDIFTPFFTALRYEMKYQSLILLFQCLKILTENTIEKFSTAGSDSALFGIKGKSPTQRRKIKCFNFGKVGHIKGDCRAELMLKW